MSQTLSSICDTVRRAAQEGLQTIGHFWPLERSVSHDELRLRSHHCERFPRFHGKGVRLSWTKARLLVSVRFDRTRRSRSGVRRPRQPVHLGELRRGRWPPGPGSGIVHIAPGQGTDDFSTGQSYGLEIYAPLDDKGVYTEGLPEYKGKDVFTAHPIIVKLLADRGALLGHHAYKHSYPHCWRCHNPVIFRATMQWFIGMDAIPTDSKNSLRAEALAELHNVKWIPGWGEDRIYEMIEKRPDWCVSRQRFWGVPIIVFFCEGCGKQLEDFTALRNVVKWFEKEGADAWYKHTPEELLPAGTKCSCGAGKWRK